MSEASDCVPQSAHRPARSRGAVAVPRTLTGAIPGTSSRPEACSSDKLFTPLNGDRQAGPIRVNRHLRTTAQAQTWKDSALMKALISVAFIALTLGFSGCNAVDCSQICERYKTCFDSSYDTTACKARCRSNTSAKTADACSDCLDKHACVPAAFACAPECGGIVP